MALARAIREVQHSPRARRAELALFDAISDSGPTPCKGRDGYESYDDDPPTAYEAMIMCHGCPVADLCLDYGREAHEDYARRGYALTGVFGGYRIERYVDRKH